MPKFGVSDSNNRHWGCFQKERIDILMREDQNRILNNSEKMLDKTDELIYTIRVFRSVKSYELNGKQHMSANNYIPIRDFSRTKLVSRVEDSLLVNIREQGLLPGDSLPSQSKLVEALGVSSSTLREALSRLEERGIIQIEHGRGTFLKRDVNQQEFHIDLNLSLTQMIINQGMVAGTSEIEVSMEQLPEEFHDWFENSTKKQYLCLRRVRTAQEKPIAYSVAYFEDRFISYKNCLSACLGSVYDFIRSHTEESITQTNASIYAEKADKFLAEKLSIKFSSPILVLRQLHMNELGEHLIVSKEYFFDCKVDVKITQK